MDNPIYFKNYNTFLIYYKKNEINLNLFNLFKNIYHKYLYYFTKIIEVLAWIIIILLPVIIFIIFNGINSICDIERLTNCIENMQTMLNKFIYSVLDGNFYPLIGVIVYFPIFAVIIDEIKAKYNINPEYFDLKYSQYQKKENENILNTQYADFWRIINEGISIHYPDLNLKVKNIDKKHDSKNKLFSLINDSIEYVHKDEELINEIKNLYEKYLEIVQDIDKVYNIIPKIKNKISELQKIQDDCEYLIDEAEFSLSPELNKINVSLEKQIELFNKSIDFIDYQLISASKLIQLSRNNIISKITLGKIIEPDDSTNENHNDMLSAIIDAANRDYAFEFKKI